MRAARLSLALESGLVAWPADGSVAVFGARAGDDLGGLPPDRTLVVQGFRPDHDALAARGWRVAVEAGAGHAAALVCLPRARELARARIAQAAGAVTPGGPVAVDGQKSDGVEAVWRDLRARRPVSEALAKAHGRIFATAAGPGLEDWLPADRRVAGGFVTRPGVFSADGPDPGSALLAAALPDALPGHVVDLGAGWGYLSRAVLERDGVSRLDLVEADHEALGCARRNLADPRARFHWADAAAFRPEGQAGAVVCNPPFHAERRADPAQGRAFIAAAARILAPAGALWLVANRHLPYAGTLQSLFREVAEIRAEAGYRVVRAAQPRRDAR